ncbi:mechanosensitive ion channel domain-containing protein [Adhaeretor mobilis]|uniref:Mechanosensitive channel MscK n=1 Tax=Adhaeretor mobilis TaxID=1930276 RepID=A0A517MV07_9BACT|nr:mechanosensitive ion channel domain-containing protein [Adhaeretor mobilis]QDS98706.1 Mechanosensitive channel MscK precursor [Adhaeretor mobilis]
MSCSRFSLFCFFATALLLGSDSCAQETSSGPTLRAPWQLGNQAEPPTTALPAGEASWDEKRTQVDERIRVAQKELDDKQTEQAADAKLPDNEKPKSSKSSRELELLKQLNDLIAQQSAVTERTEQLKAEEASVSAELEKVKTEGLEETPPYSFLVLESLSESVQTQTEQVEASENLTEAARENLSRAKEVAKEKETARINAKEAIDSNKEVTAKSDLNLALKLAELEVQIAQARIELRLKELRNDKLSNSIARVKLAQLEEKLSIVEPNTVFSEEDLQTRLDEFDKQIERNTLEMQNLEQLAQRLADQAADADREFKRTGGKDKALEAEVEAHHRESQSIINRVALLSKQLTWARMSKEMWTGRYNIATHAYTRKDLKDWEETSEALQQDLDAEKQSLEPRLQALRKQLVEVQRATQSEEAQTAGTLPWLQASQKTLRSHIDAISDHNASVDSIQRLATQFTDEIDDQRLNFHLDEWLSSAWDGLLSVWNYILLESPGEGAKAIRISTLIKGIFLLVIGIWVSKRLSNWLCGSLLPRFGVHEGAAAALQSLAFYAFVLTSALMALNFVQIPLTVFTFLAGAAAIGLGFGSQNILNNFISGVILLVEQPVRVGDLVELLGLTGVVESIGMRSTRIRTQMNQEMIVPNSSFLENNVQNWTLSDSTIRCKVEIGVAYGSPTREVARWLKQAAEKHGIIRKKPEPFVWFTGFGDSALLFELHFFIVVRTLSERMRIESDVRFMIDQFFREAGITIAFPQRDMHLDTRRPLEVRMMPEVVDPEPEPEKPSIGSPDSKATIPTGITPAQVKASQAKIAKEKKDAKEAKEAKDSKETG